MQQWQFSKLTALSSSRRTNPSRKKQKLLTVFTNASDCLYWHSPYFPVIPKYILILFSHVSLLIFTFMSPNCNIHVFLITRTTCPVNLLSVIYLTTPSLEGKRINTAHWWNNTDRSKTTYPEKSLPKFHVVHHKSHINYLVSNPFLRGEMRANNRPLDVVSLYLTLPMTCVCEQASCSNTIYTFFTHTNTYYHLTHRPTLFPNSLNIYFSHKVTDQVSHPDVMEKLPSGW